MSHKVALAPGDWIRRVDVDESEGEAFLLAGTAHGALLVTSLESGAVVGFAPPGSHVREQRTDRESKWRALGEHDPRAAVTAVAIAPGRVASGGREGTAKLWRVAATGETPAFGGTNMPSVSSKAFADESGAEPLTPMILLAYAKHPDVVTGVCVLGTDTVVTACLDGGVRVYRCDPEADSTVPQAMALAGTADLASPVTSLTAVPDAARIGPLEDAVVVAGCHNGWLAAVSEDGSVVSRWRATPPDPSTLPPAIRAVAVAGPGAIGDELSAQPYPVVFAGDGTGGLHAWSNPDMHPDVERAHGDAAWGLIRTFRGHVGAVVGLSAAPDLQFLASGAWDGTVRIWDCRTGDSMHTIGGHTAFLGSVVVVGDSVISDGCNDVVVRHAFDESGAPL